MAECLDHIAVSFRAYGKEIERVMAGPKKSSGQLMFHTSLTGGIFLKTMHPDSAVKMPNPSSFAPAHGNLTRRVFEDFLSAHNKLAELVENSRKLDLNANKISSPVTSLMKFSFGEVLLILTYHEKRHLLQAQRVMEHPGFPL
ncbi:MAG: DinB family protein [Ignavibacteriales bacterium]|nr:DinB family protein [Ignavibacteriales bacterium]